MATTAGAGAPPSDCLVEALPIPPELDSEIRRNGGKMVPGLAYSAALPWVVEHLAYSAAVPDLLGGNLSKLVCYVVSQDNSCRYCYGTYKALLRFAGFREGEIDRIERDLAASNLTPREKAAIEFARLLSRSNPRPSRAELQALDAAGFGKTEIAVLAWNAAAMCASNRVATMLALPPLLEMEEASRHPIKRFLMSLAMKAGAPKGPPRVPPVPAGVRLPCASVLDAMSATPAGPELRFAAWRAWESPVLPKRLKALVFAVVARALDCAVSEADAKHLLELEGLSPDRAEEVLSTLDSPALDDLEREAVAFARDSVRYQAQAIQARTREVAAGKPQAQLLELVMIVAMANCHTRMGCLLQVD